MICYGSQIRSKRYTVPCSVLQIRLCLCIDRQRFALQHSGPSSHALDKGASTSSMDPNTVEQRRLEAIWRARRNFPQATIHARHTYTHALAVTTASEYNTLFAACSHGSMAVSTAHACVDRRNMLQVVRNLRTMSYLGRRAALHDLLGHEETALVYQLIDERMPEMWGVECKVPPVIVLKLPRPWPKKRTHKCVAISLGLDCKGHLAPQNLDISN
jgi:hypothetical protein